MVLDNLAQTRRDPGNCRVPSQGSLDVHSGHGVLGVALPHPSPRGTHFGPQTVSSQPRLRDQHPDLRKERVRRRWRNHAESTEYCGMVDFKVSSLKFTGTVVFVGPVLAQSQMLLVRARHHSWDLARHSFELG